MTLTAQVKQVLSGDSVVLIGVPKTGPPPERTIHLTNVIAPKIAMKSQTVDRPDEVFGFESREYLRMKLIGKAVTFLIDYQENDREFGQVFLDSEDVGVDIVRAGLAKVWTTRQSQNHKNLDALRNAQELAKKAGLGLWCENEAVMDSTIRTIEYIAGEPDLTKSFVNMNKNRVLKSVIEYVKDAASFRVYFFNEKVHAQVVLSGIEVDTFRRIQGCQQAQAEPFAFEAKYFTEIRILNRDIDVRIEGADDRGNILGSLSHPKGNIALLLLKNGFARIQDWSLRLVEQPSCYREALKEAQEKKIRKWRSWQPDPSCHEVSEYEARVIEVVHGDSLYVLPVRDSEGVSCSSSGSEDENEEKRVFLAYTRCPRKATRTTPNEPWAVEAKEFVRKKTIGKKVTVVVEYSVDPTAIASVGIGDGGTALGPAGAGRSITLPSGVTGKIVYVSIYLDKTKPSINEQLVSEGLAKAFAARDTPRNEKYDRLVEREKEAAELKKNIHGTTAAVKHRCNELLGHQNIQMAKSFEESLKRLDKIEGLVEFIFAASRYKIFIPSESIAISFILGGIRCPLRSRQILGKPAMEAEEYSEEAHLYAREQLMQRVVTIKVDACDRGGNFIGVLWNGSLCMNLHFIEIGFACLSDFSLSGPIDKELNEAQKIAKERRLGIWASITSNQDAIEDESSTLLSSSLLSSSSSTTAAAANQYNHNYSNQQIINPCLDCTTILLESCVISHCNSINDFYIQQLIVDDDDAETTDVEQFQQRIFQYVRSVMKRRPVAAAPEQEQVPPYIDGEVVLAKYTEDEEWYRAKIEYYDTTRSKFKVLYIDFGNSEFLSSKQLLKCPKDFRPLQTPPFARWCSLAGLKSPPDMERDSSVELQRITAERPFQCLVVSGGGKKNNVELYRQQSSSLASSSSSSSATTNGVMKQQSINEELAATGFAIVDKKAEQTELLEKLKAAEQEARKQHLNAWQHGDIDADSDDEEISRVRRKERKSKK